PRLPRRRAGRLRPRRVRALGGALARRRDAAGGSWARRLYVPRPRALARERRARRAARRRLRGTDVGADPREARLRTARARPLAARPAVECERWRRSRRTRRSA